MVTVKRVRQQLYRHMGGRGSVGLARLLKDRANGFGITRSWLEQEAERVIQRAGLPRPVRNFAVPIGKRKRVLDLAWPDVRVGVEGDSWQHHESPGDWGHIRDRGLQASGWLIVPCVVADTRAPLDFIEMLRETLALAQHRAISCPA